MTSRIQGSGVNAAHAVQSTLQGSTTATPACGASRDVADSFDAISARPPPFYSPITKPRPQVTVAGLPSEVTDLYFRQAKQVPDVLIRLKDNHLTVFDYDIGVDVTRENFVATPKAELWSKEISVPSGLRLVQVGAGAIAVVGDGRNLVAPGGGAGDRSAGLPVYLILEPSKTAPSAFSVNLFGAIGGSEGTDEIDAYLREVKDYYVLRSEVTGKRTTLAFGNRALLARGPTAEGEVLLSASGTGLRVFYNPTTGATRLPENGGRPGASLGAGSVAQGSFELTSGGQLYDVKVLFDNTDPDSNLRIFLRS